MKCKLLILFSFLINSLATHSQSLLVDGAEWYYNRTQFLFEGIPVNYCYIDGDTLINQKVCKQYFRSTTTCDKRPNVEFLYEEGDKLFYYETTQDRFILLYDYTLEVGDTLSVEYWDKFSIGGPEFHIRVDSIEKIEFGEKSLKKFHISIDRGGREEINFEQSEKGAYIQGVGSLTNLFYFRDNGLCDGAYNNYLICYNHPEFGAIKFSDEDCESVLVTSTQEGYSKKNFQLFPNPTNEILSIISEFSLQNASISIFDLTGRVLYSKKFNFIENEVIEVGLNNLSDAMYLVRIEHEDGSKLKMKKIIKNSRY